MSIFSGATKDENSSKGISGKVTKKKQNKLKNSFIFVTYSFVANLL